MRSASAALSELVGLGFGTGRVYADGTLLMTGTQSIVVNSRDWRLPNER